MPAQRLQRVLLVRRQVLPQRSQRVLQRRALLQVLRWQVLLAQLQPFEQGLQQQALLRPLQQALLRPLQQELLQQVLLPALVLPQVFQQQEQSPPA